MSHTTSINSIVISDVDALRSAITELNREGVQCELLENMIARAYSSTQAGMTEPADYVLKMEKSIHDVGLYKTDNGYEARCDFWNGQIERQLGVTPAEGEDRNQARLGKLYQKYAIHAASRKATQQGYSVSRINNRDGSVQLRVAA